MFAVARTPRLTCVKFLSFTVKRYRFTARYVGRENQSGVKRNVVDKRYGFTILRRSKRIGKLGIVMSADFCFCILIQHIRIVANVGLATFHNERGIRIDQFFINHGVERTAFDKVCYFCDVVARVGVACNCRSMFGDKVTAKNRYGRRTICAAVVVDYKTVTGINPTATNGLIFLFCTRTFDGSIATYFKFAAL